MTRLPAFLCLAALAVGTSTAFVSPASAAPAPGDRRAAAIARANANVAAHPSAVSGAPEDRYAVRDVVLDADGTEHVRYDRSYKGLPVLGGDFVVHDDSRGALRSVSKTQNRPLDVRTRPRTTSDEATARALATFDGIVDGTSRPALVVDARTGAPALAWEVVVTGTTTAGDPSELHVLVDGTDGAVRLAYDGIETGKPTKPGGGGTGGTVTPAEANGQTLYLGTVALQTTLSSGTYSLKDAGRGGATTSDLLGRTSGSGTLVTSATPNFGNGFVTDRGSAAADAHYGVAATWDYYNLTFGRIGIAGDGKGAPSRVHYGRNYNNAFWSDACFCMTFGDGDGRQFTPLVSLDVAGHEMTHGVTSRTANLTYSGESGGLNEATSDIFGTMVEHSVNSSKDLPDFTIGEEIVPSGAKPLRYMAKPSDDGASPDCWYGGIGGLDVHYSSGIGNHFFYLLAQGSSSSYGDSPTCGAPAVTGIGNDAAARIWYRALTVYMGSGTDYHGARTATLQVATDQFGATSTQYAAVDAAWAAVGVGQ